MPSRNQALQHYDVPAAPLRRRGHPLTVVSAGAAAMPFTRVVDDPTPVTGERARRVALTLADALAVVAGVFLTALVADLPVDAGGIVAAVATTFTFVRLVRLHNRDMLVLHRSTLDEAPRILEASALGACAYWLMLPQGPGRLPLLVLTLGVATLLVGFRFAARAAIRSLTAAERCLYVGDMTVVDTVREKIEHGPANAVVVGALALNETATADDFDGVDGLRRVVRETKVTRIILAPVSLSAAATLDLIRVAKDAQVRVSIFPRLFEVVGTAVEYEELEGLMLMGVRRFGLSAGARRTKRAFDLLVGGTAFLACAPFLAIVALAVRLDSSGPILFRQVRIGRDGRRFNILKFRSMVDEAEALKDDLREHNETEGLFKITDDPRITRVGRVLRRTSLDELPQLLCVLRGDMSLVGPRPLVVDEDEQVRGLDRQRLHLTPGMTGPWQIMRSGRVPMEEMVAIDYHYVSSWTLWADVKVLLRTMGYVLGRHGL